MLCTTYVALCGQINVNAGKQKIYWNILLQAKIKVEDENDNSPSFDRHIYQGSIQENSLPGTELALGSVLQVSDPDINDVVKLQVSW